jgi:small subunit ribosomal protein S19e
MATVFDVPARELINEIALDLKKSIPEPEFVRFVKTGVNRERAPQQRDWYYIRMASILRRIFVNGPVGTQRLRTYYGGKKNRGVRPHKFYKGSGKIIRSCLQALEKQGLIKKDKKGRVITPKGQSFLSKKANIVAKRLNNLKNEAIKEKK